MTTIKELRSYMRFYQIGFVILLIILAAIVAINSAQIRDIESSLEDITRREYHVEKDTQVIDTKLLTEIFSFDNMKRFCQSKGFNLGDVENSLIEGEDTFSRAKAKCFAVNDIGDVEYGYFELDEVVEWSR